MLQNNARYHSVFLRLDICLQEMESWSAREKESQVKLEQLKETQSKMLEMEKVWGCFVSWLGQVLLVFTVAYLILCLPMSLSCVLFV